MRLCSVLALLAVVCPALTNASNANGFHAFVLGEIDLAISNGIAQGYLPGGVYWLEHQGHAYHKAYGKRALVPEVETMTEDTIFDAASLTKVVATTPAVLLLIERGQVGLDEKVHKYLPEFTSEGKDAITLRQLLTHTSGLRPDIDTQPPWEGYDQAIRMAGQETLRSPPGTSFRYSDINFFLLGDVVQRVTGKPLHEFAAKEIFVPLKMADTSFRPSAKLRERIAPTERIDNEILRGTVHDPTARFMGGVAGHAGLFTTASDLARYARMLLNGGELDGVRLFKPETVRLMTSVQTTPEMDARRGLGWDIASGYSRPRGALFPRGSYGHTGFTGTSLWIDPFSQTFWIFLSNRVHPDGKGNVLPLQRILGTLSAEALPRINFAAISNALPARPTPPQTNGVLKGEARNGIDVLVMDQFKPLKNLRLGLITNHTGQDRQRHSTIDLLFNAPEVQLKALFSPEHGLRGLVDQEVDDSKDEKTGLPIFSLYRKPPTRPSDQSEAEFQAALLRARQPTAEQLQNLDALVFDIQDIGCRFYTYISTMGGVLQAARAAELKVFVLDRVNPINGATLDGPVMTGSASFVGFHPIPVRHGMTVGELARMFNVELGINAELTVIPVQGWKRTLWFDQTGLSWTDPSPNMRNLTEAILYPGVGLIEYNPVSVGRGTDTPFEVVGAPYIDDSKLAVALNEENIPGVRFIPIVFTPKSSVFAGQPCQGVNIHLTDREKCPVVEIGVALALHLHRIYPNEFQLEKFQKLIGHAPTVDAIRAGRSLTEIKEIWVAGLNVFETRRKPYLLYE